MRIAAMADVHAKGDEDKPRVAKLLADAAEDADVILLGGDLTDHGRQSEAECLLAAVQDVEVPIVAVLGNHDHESGCASEVEAILRSGGVHCLEGQGVVLDGVGFAGAKGFAGGFGKNVVRAFGEDALKAFVNASVVEAQGLRGALRALSAPTKIALTHYSPVLATVATEPPEIHSFLGAARLAAAIDEGGAKIAFHGHAHHGALEGRTEGGVPVYNVSLPVLRRSEDASFLLIEV